MIKEKQTTITEYETEDGKVFSSYANAEKHEKYMKAPKVYVIGVRARDDNQEKILSIHKSYPTEEATKGLDKDYIIEVYTFLLED